MDDPTDPNAQPSGEDFVAEYRRREREQKESAQWHKLAGGAGEFVGMILGGAALGYGVDYLTGTWPWGMVVGLIFGFVGGLVVLVRLAQNTFK